VRTPAPCASCELFYSRCGGPSTRANAPASRASLTALAVQPAGPGSLLGLSRRSELLPPRCLSLTRSACGALFGCHLGPTIVTCVRAVAQTAAARMRGGAVPGARVSPPLATKGEFTRVRADRCDAQGGPPSRCTDIRVGSLTTVRVAP
jgi:hypothetical protein